MMPHLTFAVAHRIPLILHLTTRALEHQAETLLSAHDDYHLLSQSGAFQLFAANAQEAADLTLIARKIAELSLTPGIVAQDSYRTTHTLSIIDQPEVALITPFLGEPNDVIECPTSGQRLSFGEKRRRIPYAIDPERPMGWGGYQDRDVYLRSRAAQRVLFDDPLTEIISQVFNEYATLTGRHYGALELHRVDDARWVFVVQGIALDSLKAFVDAMRDEQGVKLGVIGIRLWRPFPEKELLTALKGKEAVTVLERLDAPGAAPQPLFQAIQAVLYQQPDVRPPTSRRFFGRNHRLPVPRLYSGIYGVGTHEPTFDHWYAALKNMQQPDGKSVFYLGLRPRKRVVRYPLLERQLQLLHNHVPALEKRYLPPTPAPVQRRVRRHIMLTTAGSGGNTASRLMTTLIYHLTRQPVIGRPEFHFYQNQPATAYQVLLPRISQKQQLPAQVIAVEDPALLEQGNVLSNVNAKDILLINASGSPETIWISLPQKARHTIQERQLQVFVVDCNAIAEELASDPQWIFPLAAQALMGAFSRILPELKVFALKIVQEKYFHLLNKQFSQHRQVVEDNYHAFVAGNERVIPLRWQDLPPVEQLDLGEQPVPWVVRQAQPMDESIFDLTYFYDTVAYLYRRNEPDLIADGPAIALGGIPGGSSSARERTYRGMLPQLQPEKCTGCLQCSAVCPDVALPMTLQEPGTFIKTAITSAEKKAGPLLQFSRVQENFIKLLYRIIQKDDLHQFTRLKGLATEAYRQLIELMKPDESTRAAMDREFRAVFEALTDLPIVRSEWFFAARHSREKGKGQVFSLVIDPDACKSCGLCVATCPEGALEMVTVDAAQVASLRSQREFLFNLPEVAYNNLDSLPEMPSTTRTFLPLLNRSIYYALIGGDNAPAGSGEKIALHLVLAAVEQTMRSRVQRFVKELDTLIATLEKQIQGQVSGALHINDFEAFAEELSRLEKKKIDIGSLAALVSETENRPEKVDKESLELQSRMLHELQQLRDQWHKGATGRGLSHALAALEKGQLAFWSGIFPYNPIPIPWVARENSPAVAEGLLQGIMSRLVDSIRIYRKGKLVADGLYEPEKHAEILKNLAYTALTPEEKELLPPVWVIGGDAMLSSHSLAGLHRLLQSQLPIKILILDNQGLGLTGSTIASTGFGQKHYQRMELALSALFSREAYVAQGSIGFPEVLFKQAQQLVSFAGPGMLVVDAPEPVALGITPAQVLEIARLAVITRTVPLFTYDPHQGQGFQAALDIDANPQPEQIWITESIALPYQDPVKLPLTPAHWAVRQLRYRKYFHYIPKKDWTPDMVPLLEYLQLPENQQRETTPYIEVEHQKQIWRVAIAPEMADIVADRQRIWQMLQELSGRRSSLVEQLKAEAQQEMAQELAVRQAALEKEFQEKQAALEQHHLQIYHQKLKERLLQLSGFPQNAQKLAMRLKELVRGNGHSQKEKV